MKGRGRRPDGFTLIELLVSLLIFSIISLAVYSSFAAGVVAWRRAQEFGSIHQTARLLLEDMAQELKNAGVIEGFAFVGEAQRLSFLTLRQRSDAEGRPANPRITRVTYEVRRPRAASNDSLFRVETSDMKRSQEGGRESELMVGIVSGLDLQYTYTDSKGQLLPWRDTWDVSDALPIGVKITLVVGGTRFTKTVFIPHGFREKDDTAKH